MVRDGQCRAACLYEISWKNKLCRGRTKMEKCPWGGRYFKHRPPLGSIVPALAGANLTPPIEISTKKSRKTSVGVGFRRPIIVVPNYNSMVKSVRQRPCKLSAASRPSGGSAGLELKLNRGRKLGSWRRKRAHMAGNIVRARWWPEQAPAR